MPEPADKDGVRRLIGMLNYLSPFIPNKATIISPLCALLKDGTPWLWTHEHKAAMQAIKNFFSQLLYSMCLWSIIILITCN
jgi:hypothetical protein